MLSSRDRREGLLSRLSVDPDDPVSLKIHTEPARAAADAAMHAIDRGQLWSSRRKDNSC
jgi:hypothetical protein